MQQNTLIVVNNIIMKPMENSCTCERPDDNTCEYCDQQQSIQILEQAAERLKGKELFTESNDRAREILSKIEAWPGIETPEEAAFRLYPRLINDPYNPMEDDNAEDRNIWIAGVKWQMAKSYSEEDMIEFADFNFREGFDSAMDTVKSTRDIFTDWFKRFKKPKL